MAAILALFVCLAAVFVTTVRYRDRAEICRTNLRLISMEVRRARFEEMPAWDAVPRGGRFWTDWHTWPVPPARPIHKTLLVCPVAGGIAPGHGTNYRGPALSPRSLRPGDPIGGDRVGNHGPQEGGNLILRSGELRSVPAGDPLWSRALETTRD